jgi:hypothetical protein
MQGIRCALFFEIADLKWSEVHYNSKSTAIDTAVIAAASQLAQKRVAILGNGAALVGARLSVAGDPNNAQWIPPEPIVIAGTSQPSLNVTNPLPIDTDAPNQPGSADMAFTTVKVMAYGLTNKYRALSYFGGCPDKVIQLTDDGSNLSFDNVPAWGDKFTALLGYMIGNWGFKALVHGAANALGAGVKVLQATKEDVGGGNIIIHTNPAIPGMNAQDPQTLQVGLRGFRTWIQETAKWGGNWTVVTTAPSTVVPGATAYTLQSSSNLNIDQIKKYGTAQAIDYAYQEYRNFEVTGVTHRKKGVRSFGPRGRAIVRRLVF